MSKSNEHLEQIKCLRVGGFLSKAAVEYTSLDSCTLLECNIQSCRHRSMPGCAEDINIMGRGHNNTNNTTMHGAGKLGVAQSMHLFRIRFRLMSKLFQAIVPPDNSRRIRPSHSTSLQGPEAIIMFCHLLGSLYYMSSRVPCGCVHVETKCKPKPFWRVGFLER